MAETMPRLLQMATTRENTPMMNAGRRQMVVREAGGTSATQPSGGPPLITQETLVAIAKNMNLRLAKSIGATKNSAKNDGNKQAHETEETMNRLFSLRLRHRKNGARLEFEV